MTRLERLLDEFDTHDAALARIGELEVAIDHACEVFVEPFGSKNPDKTVGDWRAEMLNAMRTLRALVPKKSTE